MCFNEHIQQAHEPLLITKWFRSQPPLTINHFLVLDLK